MIQEISLREHKKNQTKQALIKSAYALFAKQGYNKTSIEDITRDANFAPRTFFLHFNAKDDLLFPYEELVESSLRMALSHQLQGVTTLQTLKVWINELTAQKESGDSQTDLLRRSIIDSDRSLKARQRISLNVIETILTDAIAQDLHVSSNSVEPKIVATAAIAIFGMIDAHVANDRRSKEAQKSIDLAISFLENGLSGLFLEQA